jgi:hypothetical protein
MSDLTLLEELGGRDNLVFALGAEYVRVHQSVLDGHELVSFRFDNGRRCCVIGKGVGYKTKLTIYTASVTPAPFTWDWVKRQIFNLNDPGLYGEWSSFNGKGGGLPALVLDCTGYHLWPFGDET